MDNLLLDARAGRHSRALGDLKIERSGRIGLLIGKHKVGETVTAHKQASGVKFPLAKCIKRATFHDNTGNTSKRNTHHDKGIIRER